MMYCSGAVTFLLYPWFAEYREGIKKRYVVRKQMPHPFLRYCRLVFTSVIMLAAHANAQQDAAGKHLRSKQVSYAEPSRFLVDISSFNDPKTVQEKIYVDNTDLNAFQSLTSDKKQINMDPISDGDKSSKRINILALGGTNTWASTNSYPFLVGSNYISSHVDNIALPGIGADYPSVCFESILPDTATNYDVIFVEFVINNVNGVSLLLKRLRDRYPDAIIIYVHLWSMRTQGRTAAGKMQATNVMDIDLDWTWVDPKNPGSFNIGVSRENCYRELCDNTSLEKLVAQVGGLLYKLPTPESPIDAVRADWFAKDWLHLSETGQHVVSSGILEILSQHQHEVFSEKRLGTFGLGDQCYPWFLNAKVELNYQGGSMVQAQNKIGQYLEVDPVTGADINFESKFAVPVPIGLCFLSKIEGYSYSIVKVSNNGQPGVLLDPNYNNKSPEVQVEVFSHVGWAMPGANTLHISIVEQRETPLRIAGVFLCGSCANIGNMGPGAITYKKFIGEGQMVATDYEDKWSYPMNPAKLLRPINILALGGSNTWGAEIRDRMDAYPFLIGAPFTSGNVDNMAMRATGADYPSVCLETIVPDSGTKNYDVILLEFVINGVNGFPLLLKRLRARYPEAIIIYVQLWSMLTHARTMDLKKDARGTGKNIDLPYRWVDPDRPGSFSIGGDVKSCEREVCSDTEMGALVTEAGGYLYKLPTGPSPKDSLLDGVFARDWHHLSERGHRIVADGILEILSQHQRDVFTEKPLGTFGLGDQCYAWFMSGNAEVGYSGAKMTIVRTKDNNEKNYLEFDRVNGGSIEFDCRFSVPVPIGLRYVYPSFPFFFLHSIASWTFNFKEFVCTSLSVI